MRMGEKCFGCSCALNDSNKNQRDFSCFAILKQEPTDSNILKKKHVKVAACVMYDVYKRLLNGLGIEKNF
jgi:hypothetical protein